MNLLIKLSLTSIFFSLLSASCALSAMEIELPKEQTKMPIFITGDLQISDRSHPIRYCDLKIYEAVELSSGYKKNVKDPLIPLNLIVKKSSNPTEYKKKQLISMTLPSRIFDNCGNGTQMTMELIDLKSDSNSKVILQGTCQPNPTISQAPFHIQFSDALGEHFADPVFIGEDHKPLEMAGIIEIISERNFIRITETSFEIVSEPVCKHGKNACSTKKQYDQMVFQNAPENRMQQKNMHRCAMDRQVTSAKALPRPKSENRDKLFERYAQFEKENAERIIRKLAGKKPQPKMPTHTTMHTNVDPETKNVSIEDVEFGSQRQIAKIQSNRHHGAECNLF